MSSKTCSPICPLAALAAVLGLPLAAVEAAAADQTATAQAAVPPPGVDERIDRLTREVDELKALVHRLEEELAAQKAQASGAAPASRAAREAPAPAAGAAAAPGSAPAAGSAPGSAPESAPEPAAAAGATAGFLQGFTLNATLDGYYEYNTNDPIGRVNYLRAYDVSSNSFSLNQAAVVIEDAPDPANGRRAGLRIDLQYGQATETLQGNPANELRPDVYRNLFQAYGTYVFALGDGLSVDFGKWSSSLGIEGNYTKDQLNYSRSFWFDYLPFYHMGVRAKYPVNDQLTVNLWITNGTNQTEDFNGHKDELAGFVFAPTPALSWTFNFYDGQEHPDVAYLKSAVPAQQTLPNQQGSYVLPIRNAPTGSLHILDSYVTWQPLRALTLAAEADYVEDRFYTSTANRVTGGALYGGYQLTPKLAVAARLEYLADVGGSYTGTTQYLREGTLTLDYRPAADFLMRGEFRRDESNRDYFLGNTLGVLEPSQQTIGVGLVWWFGQKQGAW